MQIYEILNRYIDYDVIFKRILGFRTEYQVVSHDQNNAAKIEERGAKSEERRAKSEESKRQETRDKSEERRIEDRKSKIEECFVDL